MPIVRMRKNGKRASAYITVPREMLQKLGWAIDDEVNCELVDGNSIMIQRAGPHTIDDRRYQFGEMEVDDMTPAQLPNERDLDQFDIIYDDNLSIGDWGYYGETPVLIIGRACFERCIVAPLIDSVETSVHIPVGLPCKRADEGLLRCVALESIQSVYRRAISREGSIGTNAKRYLKKILSTCVGYPEI